ncbi:MAG: transposase [Desulfatiglans sp.]|jgi:REP element-mobilizing transposase RayT|nr:transposase [Desulfatiglans sp.]
MNKVNEPNRKSIRLKGYDYSTPGYYFVTVCTNDRRCLFGEIIDDVMILNDAGRMVKSVLCEIPIFYAGIDIDKFVVMPNHIHCIIIINSVGVGPRAYPEHHVATDGQPQGVAPTYSNLSLSDVVHRFKSLTTNKYIKGVKQNRWESFNGQLWQRNYYEHVIRNEIDLSETREYILNNPKKWHLDKYNPQTMETQRI